MAFAVGQRVQARGLEWDVVELEPSGEQHRLHLRCTSGALRGLEWDVLYPLEAVTALQVAFQPEHPTSLPAWRLHHTACVLDQVPGPDAVAATQPGRLRIEPYQLVPLMRALELPRVRLLLADDVGLGKTVQAGLIVTELIARRQAHRVLVVAPAGPLLRQWQQELRQRFGLRFVAITDAATLEQQRRVLEFGGNPFDAAALTLLALDFAKQERVLQELERSSWDIAIIDEAHHCISAGSGSNREATQRRRLAEVVAQRSDGLLLLTATPHDGFDPHFVSLIELLDPSLVDGRGGLVGSAYRRHVVRRLKSHLRDPASGAPLFTQRVVRPVSVDLHDKAYQPVRAFHQALTALVAPRLRRVAQGRDEADTLAFVGLLKRSVSTIAACVATLRVVTERYEAAADDPSQAEALRKERTGALRRHRRRTLRFGTLDAAEDGEAERLEVEQIAADLHHRDVERDNGRTEATLHALRALIALGEVAARSDPKLSALLQEVRAIRIAHPRANILIYTEYADSQRAAFAELHAATAREGTVLTIGGDDTEAARAHAVERCSQEDGIILLSTDSLAEGLNLQQRCCHLIHLDLPYNPNRLEQRNGRIDRYGQRCVPDIRYLYLAGTFEERLLLRLIAKYEKARAQLALMPATLGVTADPGAFGSGLMTGFAERQAGLFDDAPSPIRTLDQAAQQSNAVSWRDLLHEVDRAFAWHDRHAVRHGWFAGQGLNADTGQVTAADAAYRRGERMVSGIDLPGFVADAIAAETGRRTDPERLQLPADWTHGMDDLPGYDPATGLLRVTRSHSRMQNAAGDLLGYLGRAHPIVRHAIQRARRDQIAISAALGDSAAAPSVLLTFAIELHSARHVMLSQVIAVMLSRSGAPVALLHPRQWLHFAASTREVPVEGVWQNDFAAWVPERLAAAEAVAASTAHALQSEFATRDRRRLRTEATAQERWLTLRADELCGAARPDMKNLFGDAPACPAWKLPSPPLERLAAFVVDADNPPPHRRAAASAVSLYRRLQDDLATRATTSSAQVSRLGLLMLVPPQHTA